MSTQFDFDQLLDSWLADGPSELPDQAVTRIVQSIDDNERRLSWLPRRETMNRLVIAAGSVAAIVLVAVIGFGICPVAEPPAPELLRAPRRALPPKPADRGRGRARSIFTDVGIPVYVHGPQSGWTFLAEAGGISQGG